jgi:hypothetical protein
MDALSVVEAIKGAFTPCGAALQYLSAESRFRWHGSDVRSLPREPGVYCLLSHGSTRIQKIGKAEAKGGLYSRLLGYTGARTAAKIASDKTDQRWKRVMEGVLNGENLSVYYYPTVPQIIDAPIKFDGNAEREQLECHWARSLEKYLSKVVREEYTKRGLLETHLLLSGLAD